MSKYLLALVAACALVALTAAANNPNIYLPPVCKADEYLERCGPAACVKTCEDYRKTHDYCPAPPPHCYEPVCLCKDNKLKKDGKCVPYTDCLKV